MKPRSAVVAKHNQMQAMGSSIDDAKQGLLDDITYDRLKANLIEALENYSKRWFILHRERAVDFLKSVKEAKSVQEMMTLLQYEMSLFETQGKGEPYSLRKHEHPPVNGRDDFNRILSDFLPRFSRLLVQLSTFKYFADLQLAKNASISTTTSLYQTLQTTAPIHVSLPQPSAPVMDEVAIQQLFLDHAKVSPPLSSALQKSTIFEELYKTGYLNESNYVPVQVAQQQLVADSKPKTSFG